MSIHPRTLSLRQRRMQGFSMIEMLMAAFIMAVGILGLTTLQALVLQSSTRSRGYQTAIYVANQTLDNVENEARQRWLFMIGNPGATLPTWTPDYFAGADVKETFTFKGVRPDPNATLPVDQTAFFNVTTHPDNSPTPGSAVGGLTNFTVTVTFQEASAQAGALVTRTVTLHRMVNHG